MSSSNVTSVVKHFPTVNEGFITTLGSTISSGAATVPLTTTSGLTDGTVFVGIIEPGTVGKEQTFTGTVDTGGNQITGVKWTRGSNTGHNAGVAIVDYVSGTGNNIITKGLLVEHKQTGAHAAITADSVASAGAVSGTTGTFSGAVSGAGVNNTGDLQVRSVSVETIKNESGGNYVASGCVWSGDAYGSTRLGSMTSGVVYINGKRIAVSAVTGRTFTASRDTYIDVDNTGAITYSEVTNNNTSSPSLAANSIRLGIVVTGASSIASKLSVNQGQWGGNTNAVRLPGSGVNVPVVTDYIGTLLCPRFVNAYIGGITRTSAATSGAPGGSSVSYNGGNSIPVIMEAESNYVLTITESVLSGWSAGSIVFEVYLGTTAGAYTTQVNEQTVSYGSNAHGFTVNIPFNSSTYSGLTWVGVRIRTSALAGTVTMNTDTTRNGVLLVSRG